MNSSPAYQVVQNTAELARIVAIPRREWTDQAGEELAFNLSRILRTNGGLKSLRPVQAKALFEASVRQGLFGPIRVGGGKTLITILAPLVLDSSRPLLLVPAKLIEKTKRDMRSEGYHWTIPRHLRIVSYELLGREQSSQLLDLYQPDLIIADEVHKLKNPKAAVTQRVARYMLKHLETRFIGLSGTITKRSVKDYAHVLRWCVKGPTCPIPYSWSETEQWSAAIDETPGRDNRPHPGALVVFCSPEERQEGLTGIRKAIRRRITDTAGVIATREGFEGSSLIIEALHVSPPKSVLDHLAHLRSEWETPDGWTLNDSIATWRHTRELALAFYYKWEPRPPDSWMIPRKNWSAMCRYILSNNQRRLDSELMVTKAVAAGHYPYATEALTQWRAVKDTFEPNTVPVWIDDFAIKAVADFALHKPGTIVWTEHTAFAQRLRDQTGLAYYGRKGEDARTGRIIEDHNPRESLIASVASNSEGRNLQAFSKNLIVSCPPNGLQLEQLLARTHRDGQEADEVQVTILFTVEEHHKALEQAISDAAYIEAATGQAQKLRYADFTF